MFLFVDSVSRRAMRIAATTVVACAGVAFAGPFASEVIQYDAGVGTNPDFQDASVVLGSASRFTGELTAFPGVVSPFSPPFGTNEIVSVGFGGSLTLRFDTVIRDADVNPFGLDFIVFGNAGFIDSSFPEGSVGDSPAMFGVGAAVRVEASADGVNWSDVATRHLDLFPTLGYQDAGPFDGVPGSVRTNFRQAMDPALGLDDIAGLSYAGLVGLYGGSGGGIGFDLAGSGLTEAQFVRFSHAGLNGETFEIDAVSVVPTPSSVTIMLAVGFGACRRRRVGV